MNEKYYVYDQYGGYNVYDLPTLEDFVVKKGPWCFGNNLKDKRWSFKTRTHSYCCRKYVTVETGVEELAQVKYVIYSQDNELVTCRTVDQIYTQGARKVGVYPSYRHSHKRWPYIHPNYPGFRNGPVPGTGVYKHSNYYRPVRTTQEKRFNHEHYEYTRGKRRNTPSYWDNVKISDHYTGHSWKKQHKKKQWM